MAVVLLLFLGNTLGVCAQTSISTPTDSTAVPPIVTQDLLVKGQRDAEAHYKKYKGAGTATLFVSLLSPLVGLLPAITCSATTPKEQNLGYPQANLFAQRDYYQGYTKKAKKIKQRKVWGNWAIGLGVNIVAVAIINAGK